MEQKSNVLFIHVGESSFVKEDLLILKKFTRLSTFYFRPSKSVLSLVRSFLHQFFWLLIHIWKAKAIYCWFSDYHGFLPVVFARVFKISIITVLGGFDCNKNEKLNYGIFCSRWRTPLGKFIIRNSTLLLPVDRTLIKTDAIAANWPSAHPNGLSENVPEFNTSWMELPTGYNSDLWDCELIKRDSHVTTVAIINSVRTAYVKGIDLMIETARLLPGFSFLVVGISENIKEKVIEEFEPPRNMHFISKLPRMDLRYVYKEASVYLQLSRTEGLPNVLCEAMLCGCVPVGSPVFGIPKAIGDVGFIANYPDPVEISSLVKLAHQKADNLRRKARQHIINNFSLQKRENSLRNVFENLDILN